MAHRNISDDMSDVERTDAAMRWRDDARIRELEAEAERLRESVADYEQLASKDWKLLGEVERLREALSRLADPDSWEKRERPHMHTVKFARAALASGITALPPN